jgi:hypothetical protein
MQEVPGRVGEVLSHGAKWMFDYLEYEAPPRRGPR